MATTSDPAYDTGVSAAPDLVVAHSQGAILTTALLALRRLGDMERPHPALGYVLNGVAWPNPMTNDLEALRLPQRKMSLSTSSQPPRVLMIVGRRDAMNPPEQATRVRDALTRAGFDVTFLQHDGGHAVPVGSVSNAVDDSQSDDGDKRSPCEDDETMAEIMSWLQEG